MGFFGYLIGSSDKKVQTNGKKLGQRQEYSVSREEIRRIVSRYNVRSLDAAEERLIEDTIDKRRAGDGRISLFQIDEALRKLVNIYKISDIDRKGIMKVFTDYFTKKNV
ncbi:MAG: hypothetical protein ABII02_01975 [Candidatus Magasanikbacteria bacterium]